MFERALIALLLLYAYYTRRVEARHLNRCINARRTVENDVYIIYTRVEERTKENLTLIRPRSTEKGDY